MVSPFIDVRARDVGSGHSPFSIAVAKGCLKNNSKTIQPPMNSCFLFLK
jgi:hypothetical protein